MMKFSDGRGLDVIKTSHRLIFRQTAPPRSSRACARNSMDSCLSFMKARTKAKAGPTDRRSRNSWARRSDALRLQRRPSMVFTTFTETFTSRVVPSTIFLAAHHPPFVFVTWAFRGSQPLFHSNFRLRRRGKAFYRRISCLDPESWSSDFTSKISSEK
jgi:hypothetical protein